MSQYLSSKTNYHLEVSKNGKANSEQCHVCVSKIGTQAMHMWI